MQQDTRKGIKNEHFVDILHDSFHDLRGIRFALNQKSASLKEVGMLMLAGFLDDVECLLNGIEKRLDIGYTEELNDYVKHQREQLGGILSTMIRTDPDLTPSKKEEETEKEEARDKD
jgi:hypothetical protein